MKCRQLYSRAVNATNVHLPCTSRFGIIFGMERYFNIAGPCIPGEHYILPALDRLPEIRRLVSRRQYFVIHAPRQTGKTLHVVGL